MSIFILCALSVCILWFAMAQEKALESSGNFPFNGLLIIPAVLVIVALWCVFGLVKLFGC